MSTEPRTVENTPMPGPGSWLWDDAAGCWVDNYPKDEPAAPAAPADPEPAPE